MKEQDPEKRIYNFDEVPLGYSREEALAEASRCLQCVNPLCVRGCPAQIDIPGFIKSICDGDNTGALEIIRRTNNLPGVCGRVCPQEQQCEKACVLSNKGRSVKIGHLERYAADSAAQTLSHKHRILKKSQNLKPEENLKKVAVIGSGPAGLTCAADLAGLGYRVTVFEALHKAGGVLTYGVPRFRLPGQVVEDEIAVIKSLGVEIKYDYVIGKIKSIDDLRSDGYKAFFIATGAGLPYFIDIPGENLNGVYSANEFLTRVNLMHADQFPEYDTPLSCGRRVAVIGGGNVAMDAARCARRFGAEVFLVYRRSQEEMPAREEEIRHAREEGIIFEMLTGPTCIKGLDSKVTALGCVRNKLGEPDQGGRRRPEEIRGSDFDLDVDTVIVAIGNGSNPLLADTLKDVELTSDKNIKVNENGCTNVSDIFAGGDAVSGASTVIAAIGAGKRAASAINDYLSS